MKQAANGIAGLLEPFKDFNPFRNTFELIPFAASNPSARSAGEV